VMLRPDDAQRNCGSRSPMRSGRRRRFPSRTARLTCAEPNECSSTCPMRVGR
jgi:hypothetical protein